MARFSDAENAEPDELAPVSIEHQVDEIWIEGRLEQRYNFIDYRFVVGEDRYRARTYLDDASEAAVFGPSDAAGQSTGETVDPRVLAYLRRRFAVLKRLGASGYEPL